VLLSISRSLLKIPRPRDLAVAALGTLLATAAALCGAQAPPTSEPAEAAPAASSNVPAPARYDIALVLPLDAPAYARAADAVRAGFMAAAEAAGAASRCIVIGHGADSVIAAFDAARDKGVSVIVGPLVRDDLKTIAIAGGDWPVTIALNQLDDGSALPPNMYSLALAVESDARVLARRAWADGARKVDVVEGDGPLVHRLAGAFAAEWIAQGGAAPDVFDVQPSRESLTDLRKSLLRATPDAVLLAVDVQNAALVKPFLPNVAVYASSLVFERPLAAAAHDLDDIRIVEIPWILTPDAPELALLPRREYGGPALNRLYALGLDAFRVAHVFLAGTPRAFDMEGAIGHLTLDERHQFQRDGRMGIYRDGQVVPLDGPR
jgi:outer membrane PBP1 activator LpoA protein